MSKKGLGRGFESLIPTDISDEFDLTLTEDRKVSELLELDLDEVKRDVGQPRKKFDEEALEALASSIKEHGVLQPIVVIREEGEYRIVAGERRWRAAKMAGLSKIPAIVRSLDAQNRLELSIIENAQREDLNAVELATAYAKLKQQFNLSNAEIAKRVGKGETAIVNTLRLLNLPAGAQKAMVEHRLTEGVMRPLVSAEPKLVMRAVERIVAEGWTARQVERFMAENKKKSSTVAMKTDRYLKQEAKLEQRYGVKARIRSRSITLAVKNEVELEKLIAKLSD